jgi:hypothetical protein
MRLVVADEAPAPAVPAGSGEPTTGVASAIDHVMQAFEGAEVVEE